MSKQYRVARKARTALVQAIRDKNKPLIIDEYNHGATMKSLGKKYNLHPTTVSKYIQDAEK